MQFLSIAFILLWAISFALYYLLPAKYRWYVLLAASLLFYCVAAKGIPVNLLLTGITTWLCGIYLERSLAQQKQSVSQIADKEEKKKCKAVFGKKRKTVQILYILFNMALLVFYKYAVLCIPFFDARSGSHPAFLERVVMPLGISFYTLTAISYVVDAGRENCRVEKNFLKVLLFLFYFPAITQGPFHRFDKFSTQLLEPHDFSFEQMLRGIQRFVWGAFKKLVIADRIGIFVDRVYGGDMTQTGGSIFIVATVLYILQLYADFSGYIDMAMGVSETFSIALPENFKRPLFSKSVAEFWHRWHITLGTWFKDYIMFSFVMSGVGRKISKTCKKKWNGLGRQVVPIMGTMLVWLLTGMWHGRTSTYFVWGIYYGIIMSLSLLLEEQFVKWKNLLHVGNGKAYGAFCMVRTWMIVFIADLVIRCTNLGQVAAVFKAIFKNLQPGLLLSKTITSYGLNKYEFIILFAALLIWLCVSVLEEKGKDVRDFLLARPILLRWACYYGIVFFLLIFGIYGGGYDKAVFLYQSF